MNKTTSFAPLEIFKLTVYGIVMPIISILVPLSRMICKLTYRFQGIVASATAARVFIERLLLRVRKHDIRVRQDFFL